MTQNETQKNRIQFPLRNSKVYWTLIFCIHLVGPMSLVHASEDTFKEQPFVSSTVQGQVLDLTNIAAYIKVYSPKSNVNTADFIPLDLTPTNDQYIVSLKIMDHCIETLFEKSGIKDTSFAKNTLALKKMDLKLNFKEAKISGKDQVVHKLKLQVRALSGEALVHYQGRFESYLKYHLSTSQTSVQIAKHLTPTSKVYYTHSLGNSVTQDMVGFQWSW